MKLTVFAAVALATIVSLDVAAETTTTNCDQGIFCSSSNCGHAMMNSGPMREPMFEPPLKDNSMTDRPDWGWAWAWAWAFGDRDENGPICNNQCPNGQYCARGSDTCRAPKEGTTECFNPKTSLWTIKCDEGIECTNGKCDYGDKTPQPTPEPSPKDKSGMSRPDWGWAWAWAFGNGNKTDQQQDVPQRSALRSTQRVRLLPCSDIDQPSAPLTQPRPPSAIPASRANPPSPTPPKDS